MKQISMQEEKMEDYYWFGQHGTKQWKYMQIDAIIKIYVNQCIKQAQNNIEKMTNIKLNT